MRGQCDSSCRPPFGLGWQAPNGAGPRPPRLFTACKPIHLSRSRSARFDLNQRPRVSKAGATASTRLRLVSLRMSSRAGHGTRRICWISLSRQAAILWRCVWSAGSELNTSATTTLLSSQRVYSAPCGNQRTWRSRQQTNCSATCSFSSETAGCRRDRKIRGGRWRDRTSAPLRARRVSTPVHYRSANRPS